MSGVLEKKLKTLGVVGFVLGNAKGLSSCLNLDAYKKLYPALKESQLKDQYDLVRQKVSDLLMDKVRVAILLTASEEIKGAGSFVALNEIKEKFQPVSDLYRELKGDSEFQESLSSLITSKITQLRGSSPSVSSMGSSRASTADLFNEMGSRINSDKSPDVSPGLV